MGDTVPHGLACPRDRRPLSWQRSDRLICNEGHVYPVVDGIPVLLTDDLPPTHASCSETLEVARRSATGSSPTCDVVDPAGGRTVVDGFVQREITRSCGNLYGHLQGTLPRYPIPEFPLPPGEGRRLVDVGCNWGRWSISAARRGYRVVGLDPSLQALRAAQRVAADLNVEATFVAGDARCLPFLDGAVDVVFSYSVLQHFAKPAVRECLSEAARVTTPGGTVTIQMANAFGARQLLNRTAQWLRDDDNPFRVRPWTPGELHQTFEKLIGPTRSSVDGFFSLNAQPSDLDLMTPVGKVVVGVSEMLKRATRRFPWLLLVADSLYLHSTMRSKS